MQCTVGVIQNKFCKNTQIVFKIADCCRYLHRYFFIHPVEIWSEGTKTFKWTFKIEIWPVWSQWGVLLQKLKSTKRGVKSSRNTQWVLKKYLLVDKKVCFGTTAALLLWGIFFIKQTKTWITLGIYNHDVVQTLENNSYICFFADEIQLLSRNIKKRLCKMSLSCTINVIYDPRVMDNIFFNLELKKNISIQQMCNCSVVYLLNLEFNDWK